MKDHYLKIALNEAKKAYLEDEVPVGCVIVFNNEIIARSHNNKEKKQSSIYHAEIEAIKKACKKLNSWHLDNCEMYVTLEPCMMCTGAIINSRIKKIYYGCKDLKGGALESNIKIKEIKLLNHYPEYECLNNEDCSNILKEYFKNKRK